MPDEALPGDRRELQGAHPRRRHLPGRAVAPGRVPGARTEASRSTGACACRTPRPTCSSCGCSGMELAGSSPEPLVRVEGRRVSSRPIAGTRPRGSTEVARPAARARAAGRPEGAGGARDAGRPRPQRPRTRVRARSVRPTELMEVERFSKVMHIVSTVEGDLRARHASARRARRHLPGRHGDRRAEASRDGADRRARAHAARSLRGRGRLPHVRRATSTSASRSARPSSPTGGVSIQIGRGHRGRLRPADRAARDEGEGRGAAAGGRPGEGSADVILVVDHYDSFTYNLVQLIESLGRSTVVVKSDEKPAEELVADEARRGGPVARSGPPARRGLLHRACSSSCPTPRRSSACASATRRSASRPAAPSIARRRCTARRRSCTTRVAGSSRA